MIEPAMTERPASVDPATLAKISAHIRGRIVMLSHRFETSHLASALSCVDIVVAAYWSCLRIDPKLPFDPARDRFILSKGHAAMTLYTVLAERGFFDPALLDTFNQNGSILPEQPAPNSVPGVELATGSLGHGLPVACGLALAARIQRESYRVMAVLSDGECNEGSVWEAALFAAAQKLSNLMIVVDYNKWQATGRSDEVLGLAPLVDKWRAFGWNTQEIDGHDHQALIRVMQNFPDNSGKPIAIIAHTVKGKGVSFMEDDNNWHYRTPTSDETVRALQELGVA